jgi:hypothetical protein
MKQVVLNLQHGKPTKLSKQNGQNNMKAKRNQIQTHQLILTWQVKSPKPCQSNQIWDVPPQV